MGELEKCSTDRVGKWVVEAKGYDSERRGYPGLRERQGIRRRGNGQMSNHLDGGEIIWACGMQVTELGIPGTLVQGTVLGQGEMGAVGWLGPRYGGN
jgi:hypothetical protein